MRCGVVHDSYQTLRSLTFVLPSRHGDRHGAHRTPPSASPRAEPELADGLAAIRDEIRADAELSRAHPAEVRDQEHDRLPAVRVPRRRRAAGDLPAAARRLGGHARVRRRGGVRHRPARPPHDHRAALLRRHRRRRRARARRWSRRARRAVELMVDPTLIAASYVAARHARGVARAAARGRGAARRAARRRPGRARRAGAARAGRARGHELLEPAALHARPEETEVYWRVREGMQGIVGRLPPAGHVADHRGRLRAARAHRRVGARHPGAARQARVPDRRRRPRLGRQPALPAHARTSPSPPTASATRASWASSSS